MKKIFLLSIMLIISMSSLYSSEKLSIALFDLYGNNVFGQEAQELSDQLKVDLINSGRFEIISAAKLQDEMMNQDIISVSSLTLEDAAKISSELEADFFLSGEIKVGDFSSTVVINFAQPISQDIIFTKELPLIDGQVRAISRSIVHDIIAQSNLVSNIKMEDISLLVNRGEFQSAEKLLLRYQFHFGQTEESEQYLTIINKGLAEENYKSSQEYLKVYDFDSALLAINKAIYYDPDNFIYRDYSEVLLDEQDSFMNVKLGEIIEAIYKLIEQEKYDSAEILLERATSFGFQSDEFKKIAREIREGKDEIVLWKSAQSKLWARKYDEARVDITEAIRLNPQKTQYTEFLIELEKLEKESETVTSTWNQYKQQMSSISPMYLLGIKKDFDEMISLGFSLYGVRNYDHLVTLDEVSYGSLSFQFEYFKNWSTGLDLGFEEEITYSELLYTLVFSSMYTNYNDSVLSLDTNGYDQQDKVIYNQLDLSITGGVSLSFFSFLIGLGFEAGIGGGIYNTQLSVPAINTKESDFSFHFTPAIGLNSWFVWNLSDNLSLVFSYNFKYVFIIPAIPDLKNRGQHHFLFSFGYRGFDWW